MHHLTEIRAALSREGIDCVLLRTRENRAYATGFLSSAGAVVITKDKGYFFTDFRYIEAARAAVSDFHIDMAEGDRGYHALIRSALSRHNVKTLGIEDDAMPHTEYIKEKERLPAEFVSAGAMLRTLRAVKSEAEVERIRASMTVAERAFSETLEMIRPGVRERELAAKLIYEMLKGGAQELSFYPIVAAGERASMPHAVPGDREIRAGEFVLIDFGCIKDGYCSDITRTVAVSHVTGRMAAVYDTVLKAQSAGISAIVPGVSAKSVDRAARQVIEHAGFRDNFGHSFGHGVGLIVHEEPHVGPSSAGEICKGHVFSAEPGIYLPGEFGVRIEDLVYVSETGTKNLTTLSKSLLVL